MYRLFVVGLGIRLIKSASEFVCPVTGEEYVNVIFSSGKSNPILKTDFMDGVDKTSEFDDVLENATPLDLDALGLSKK